MYVALLSFSDGGVRSGDYRLADDLPGCASLVPLYVCGCVGTLLLNFDTIYHFLQSSYSLRWLQSTFLGASPRGLVVAVLDFEFHSVPSPA